MTLASITDQANVSSAWGLSSWFAVVIYIITVIALWRVFSKAGYPGILAIIPIVNVVILVKIAGFSAWMTLLYLIPIVNIIFGIIVAIRVGRAFDKGALFSFFLLWIPALQIIGYGVLGFGSARYRKI